MLIDSFEGVDIFDQLFYIIIFKRNFRLARQILKI